MKYLTNYTYFYSITNNRCMINSQRCINGASSMIGNRYFSTDKNVSKQVEDIVGQIEKLSLLEVIELTSLLQTRLGIPDIDIGSLGGGAAPAGAAAPAAAAAAPPKSEYQVRLTKVPEGAKYKIIKELREIKPSLSLMETKGLVEKLPSVIADKVSKEEADKIIAKIKAAGAESEAA
ncbi:hypothetical protein PPL_05481 [Heterostelium album PN500]|uniref:Ribosomal protein L12 n=1 Tax=Heterostelium pallidum (strain ATCC 26659 / Pp 5 / PN500) TaxID=670386 RepID=D3BAA6_HETP5|nr:hypothetical protein PPL_05481 [Heterostelium album PN500]EFA81493.1 hypothetical protein PPL_05481 [Heterostelium album PN500]|eukprot:XP_020433611.1 hypothetical protein PPL_05481 [Heterostelium album PN500]